MAYRDDIDLDFLSRVSSSDLEPLVSLLTHDPKDNERRFNEELTTHEKYKYYGTDYRLYWDVIAEELQRNGGNTIASFFRGGKGVLYREILIDVCKKQKVNFNKKSETRLIEDHLLAKVLEKSFEKMTQEELKTFLRRCKVSPEFFSSFTAGTTGAIMAILNALNAGGFFGFRLASTASALAIASFGSSAATIFGGSTFAFVAGRLVGMVNIVVSLPLLLAWMTSPAYRVTIPACILVAAMRKKYDLSPEDLIKMQKEEELALRFTQVLNEYRRSDKKMMGMYILALSAVREIRSSLTVDDVEALIFGLDHDSIKRVKKVLSGETTSSLNFEDSIRYAIQSCGCSKIGLKTTLKCIVEWEDEGNHEAISLLFQRYDEIVNQM